MTSFPTPTFDLSAYNQTNLEALGLFAVLVLGAATLTLPRRWALVPAILLVCFVSMRQRVVIFGLDFNVVRLLVLFGWTRILMRGEMGHMRWLRLDTAVTAFGIVSMAMMILRKGDLATVIFLSGVTFDLYGLYFLFRHLLRDWRDVHRIASTLMLVSIPIAGLFAIEYYTGRNPFFTLGGVAEFSEIRLGRVRATGVFGHPILAGCFWAALSPLVAALWWSRVPWERALVPVSLLSISATIFFTASSSPIMLAGVAVLGGLAWPARYYMRELRWGVVGILALLHLVMQAPVWHLLSRVGTVGGSTAWHRFYLIDQAIANFGGWWLIGTDSTYLWGWGLGDVTNHYIFVGARSGFFALLLLITIMALAFQRAGKLWRAMSKNPAYLAMSWGLGVALFANLAGFMTVAYTSQLMVMWHLLLALVATPRLRGSAKPKLRAPPLEPR